MGKHVGSEFATKDPATALDTTVPDAYVNHVPVMTGGMGREQLTEFYSNINEAAFLLGYDDPNSFYRAFKTWEGTTSAHWRSARGHTMLAA